MAASDDQDEWENNWVLLEQAGWGQSKKKDQMREFSRLSTVKRLRTWEGYLDGTARSHYNV